MSERDYAALDAAWEALDRGEPEHALELCSAASDELAETWVLRATAALDLDDIDTARGAALKASELEDGEGDPELLVLQAEIDLRDWEIDAAREHLERAQSLGKSPVILSKLALIEDLDGDFGRADRLLREAHKLDPQNFPTPPRLSEHEFDAQLKLAVHALPAQFQAALESVPVIVEPMPSRSVVGDDPAETPPDLLGLFSGASRLEQLEDGAAQLPPTIHLFQRNIERSSVERGELVEQIRVTLYHELAHYLGFDEEGVADLGLE
ncbi:MAG: metallopeptidase family protein [Planctomycetes bacterium]|nr:metallopeptidase family protein [Planctomycetota bacterium]